ncbi:hypothetical protein [Vibrio crassostreae]|uniref:hypothetical protein n=1 Tax=Vibrio crassostreae TaxID=246167 RepID=UPI001052847A|nr:hypothetical protein [Vibrio crassostreae]TCW20760.1 hypothetical protein EDB48_10399 [Vibrio crassostreae]
MRFKYFAVLCVFTASVGAGEVSVPIWVNVIKSTNSSEISLEYDKDIYPVVYRTIDESFAPLQIPFRVRSKLSVTKQYRVSLINSAHKCNGNPFNVTTELDGSLLKEGEQLNKLSFQFSDLTSNSRWSEHLFVLKFDEVMQGVNSQYCQGNIGISVGLEI